jgi:hypothetical protein
LAALMAFCLDAAEGAASAFAGPAEREALEVAAAGAAGRRRRPPRGEGEGGGENAKEAEEAAG